MAQFFLRADSEILLIFAPQEKLCHSCSGSELLGPTRDNTKVFWLLVHVNSLQNLTKAVL